MIIYQFDKRASKKKKFTTMTEKQIRAYVDKIPLTDPKRDDFISFVLPSLSEKRMIDDRLRWVCVFCESHKTGDTADSNTSISICNDLVEKMQGKLVTFAHFYSYIRHLSEKHSELLPSGSDGILERSSVISLSCHICDKTFMRKEHYKRHLSSRSHQQRAAGSSGTAAAASYATDVKRESQSTSSKSFDMVVASEFAVEKDCKNTMSSTVLFTRSPSSPNWSPISLYCGDVEDVSSSVQSKPVSPQSPSLRVKANISKSAFEYFLDLEAVEVNHQQEVEDYDDQDEVASETDDSSVSTCSSASSQIPCAQRMSKSVKKSDKATRNVKRRLKVDDYDNDVDNDEHFLALLKNKMPIGIEFQSSQHKDNEDEEKKETPTTYLSLASTKSMHDPSYAVANPNDEGDDDDILLTGWLDHNSHLVDRNDTSSHSKEELPLSKTITVIKPSFGVCDDDDNADDMLLLSWLNHHRDVVPERCSVASSCSQSKKRKSILKQINEVDASDNSDTKSTEGPDAKKVRFT